MSDSFRPPIMRSQIHKLKEKEDSIKKHADEEVRRQKIKEIVSIIYDKAIILAKNTTYTSYYYIIPHTIIENSTDKFYTDNITDIIDGLKTLFLDCTIECKKYNRLLISKEGYHWDITTLDDKARENINRNCLELYYIIINWS